MNRCDRCAGARTCALAARHRGSVHTWKCVHKEVRSQRRWPTCRDTSSCTQEDTSNRCTFPPRANALRLNIHRGDVTQAPRGDLTIDHAVLTNFRDSKHPRCGAPQMSVHYKFKIRVYDCSDTSNIVPDLFQEFIDHSLKSLIQIIGCWATAV